ncbi:hypothetical protein D9758_016910 [Tetrapyrgos nigripes]|uniref:Uncharacterized protein n=1 Tax=Tetrapyrgos nigripes TaxID=182062 RepID=A0A8H5FG89_9AGAR|nr:hypothetical protein D9758_016910 [Tetrapyrgos nigripes]
MLAGDVLSLGEVWEYKESPDQKSGTENVLKVGRLRLGGNKQLSYKKRTWSSGALGQDWWIETTPNGWTRCWCKNSQSALSFTFSYRVAINDYAAAWLAQANHLVSCMGLTASQGTSFCWDSEFCI